MKYLILIIFILVTFASRSQTTNQEYNYITKGYKIQVESGLDPKSEYIFKDFGTFSSLARSCQFIGLYRKKSGKLAGTMAIFNDLNGRKYYFCIPAKGSSEELFYDYKKSLSLLDGYSSTIDYIYFLSEFLSQQNK